MTAHGFVLVCLGAVLMALHIVGQTYVLKHKSLNIWWQLVAQWWPIAAVLLVAAIVFPAPTLLQARPNVFWMALAGTTVVNIFIQFAQAKSRQLADASLTTPVQAMTPGLITVTALVIGEVPSRIGVFGIVLIAVGTYVHGRENAKTLRDWFAPFLMLRLPQDFESLSIPEQVVVRKNRDGLRWAYLSAVLGTMGILCDGLTARNGSILFGWGLHAVALALVFTVMALWKGGPFEPPKIKRERYVFWLLGLVFAAHIVFVMAAFRFGDIAYIGSLKRLSIPLTVLFAWWLLGENKAKYRIWPVIVVTIGAVCLGFDHTIGDLISHLNSIGN